MREFILRALKARTSRFDISNLEDAGKMHIVCDCVVSSLFIANDIRRDTIFHAVLEGPSYPPKIISFYGNKLRNLNENQRHIATVINEVLIAGEKLKLNEEFLIDGIKITKKSFEALVKEKSKNSQLIYLHNKGQDIRNFSFSKDVTFVFGDYIGMPRKTEKLLDRLGSKKVSVGPQMIFASQCITLANNELDRIKQKI